MGNKLVYGIVTTIVSILVIVVLSIWQYQRIRDTGAVVRHANQVLYQTQDVLNIAMQYELNVKNFLLTHDSSFLDSASRSFSLLPTAIDSLKRLTADNPDQVRRLDSLQGFNTLSGGAFELATDLNRNRNAVVSVTRFQTTLTRLADEELCRRRPRRHYLPGHPAGPEKRKKSQGTVEPVQRAIGGRSTEADGQPPILRG
jgi:CHASE3 domain sensor protein